MALSELFQTKNKQLAAIDKVDEVVVYEPENHNNELEEVKKLFRAEGNCRVGETSLWPHH